MFCYNAISFVPSSMPSQCTVAALSDDYTMTLLILLTKYLPSGLQPLGYLHFKGYRAFMVPMPGDIISQQEFLACLDFRKSCRRLLSMVSPMMIG